MSWKDDVEDMQAFVDRHGVTDFPHAEDDGTVFAAYDMVSQPGWAFINDDGATTTVIGGLGAEGIAENLEALAAN